MSTCAALIDETLDLLYGSTRTKINTLRSDISAVDTSVTFTYQLSGITEGALLAVGLEVMQVVATDPTSTSATVVRGQRGSSADTHLAGDVATVNPTFPRWSVFRSLNSDLASLSAQGLYTAQTVDITYNPAVQGYDLTDVADLDDILEVRYQDVGPAQEWPLIPKSGYRLWRSVQVSDFSSGFAIILYEPGYPGRPIRVAYRAPLVAFETEDDETDSTGLPSTAADLPPLGAALRLLWPREVERNFFEAQPDTRRPNEVPAGANLGAARGWAAMRQQRITEELKRLARRWPMVKR